MNVPCVPSRSGTHMAESWAPRNFSGGKVIGTRRMVLQMLCSPRIFQNGLDLRIKRSSGLPMGKRYLPILTCLSTVPMRVDDRIGK